MGGFDLGTILGAAVGAFLASLFAEWIASVARRSQAEEAQRDADLADIREAIATLRGLGEKYWSKSGEELGDEAPILAAHITATQHHVGLLYASMFSGESKRTCDVAFTRLMDALSGGDFGSPERQASMDRVQRIHLHALTFRHVARAERRRLKRKPLA